MLKMKPTPNTSIVTAVLIDGSFFIQRYRRVFINGNDHSPKTIVDNMCNMVFRHVRNEYLYRILFYDCQPFDKKIHHILSGKVIDFSKTKQYDERMEIFKCLKQKRKVALRLGHLKESGNWIIHANQIKGLLTKEITVDDLKERNVRYDLRQKGVDIKIGVDITSLSIKRMVNKIILISGDSDFVPAAKMARREGIDFILDPMWNQIAPSLFEHIDGLKSTCPHPIKNLFKDKYPYIK